MYLQVVWLLYSTRSEFMGTNIPGTPKKMPNYTENVLK